MQQPPVRTGTLLRLDVSGVEHDKLNSLDYLRNLFHEAAEKAQVTVLAEAEHAFSPQGATLMLLLSESHLTIHTWPEFGIANIDFFTCGPEENAQAGAGYIIQALNPSHYHLVVHDRGGIETKVVPVAG